MIPNKDILEIKNFLEKSENPLFLFDDDVDGLSSYLLLKKHIDKGNGIIVKTSPNLNINFLSRIQSYKPDFIFILDKPLVDQELIDKINVPMIWIDHHGPYERKGIKYYNPRLKNKKDGRPTSYWCYQVVKENMWIAMVGCVGDYFLPEFTKEFSKKYPRLINKFKLDEIKFNSELGKLVKIISFMLKGKIDEVNKFIEILSEINDPDEILNMTTKRGKEIYQKYDRINKIYLKLLNDSLNSATKDKLLLHLYNPSSITFNEELANELIYKFPKKIVIVGREKEGMMRLSLRSRRLVLPKIIDKALKGLNGMGGGHEHACGVKVAKEDFPEFIERIKKFIS
ncbi:DHH family phosphoesterase [Candidatus Woesearchaeota archaeon]|nr:DHH family phosphoesterase [Candidatus Woesearchaeota archaeon]